MDAKNVLEGYLNQMQFAHQEFSKAKGGLLDIALVPFEALFVKDSRGKYISSNLEDKDKKEVLKTFKEDLLPMFEENKYQKGIDHGKAWLKVLEEH